MTQGQKEVRAPFDGALIATIDMAGAEQAEQAMATAYAPVPRPRCLAASSAQDRDPAHRPPG